MTQHHRGREHADTIGTMGYNTKEPIQRNTIFRLASMTKPITAVLNAVPQWVRAGGLDQYE